MGSREASSLVTGVDFSVRDASRPLLVVGPSLGTSVTSLWERAAGLLAPDLDVVGWDLPGHGASPHASEPWAAGAVTMADLAAGVLEVASAAQAKRGDEGAPFWYAGVSVGGGVGIQLLLDSTERIEGAFLLCTGAQLGEPQYWLDRAELVEQAGTPTQVAGSAERWFGRGFLEREPRVAGALLGALQTTDRFGYAATCRALADFDARERVASISRPVVVIAGGDDQAVPIDTSAHLANEIPRAEFVLLPHVAHQAPAEAPDAVARVISSRVAGSGDLATTSAAMRVRREVLGDAHVDRAIAATTPFSADFQDFITRNAWGEIWTRPGLDRRMRSAVTISALVTRGHWDELAMHVKAARRNGLSEEEISEILLQLAVYASIPNANQAFHVAQKALAEPED
jgi:3-oxoadipate enol-lactonase/4-carboxymuconolactone decarboxylase